MPNFHQGAFVSWAVTSDVSNKGNRQDAEQIADRIAEQASTQERDSM